MATRGKFGRLPAATGAASLANVIVSIAREAQQQRDSNIMDAWKNGGLFQGQPVTDEQVLAYWAERMKHVSATDPLHDTYQETYAQLQYTIAESKISTLYAQGKVSAGAMAAFYTNWAKKVPVNSEFHRVLERNAAQFIKALKKAGGGRRKGSGGIGAAALAKLHNEGPAVYLTTIFTDIARANGLIDQNEKLTAMRLKEGGTVGGNVVSPEDDPGQMLAILDIINHDPKYAGQKKQVLQALHTIDKNIPATGDITPELYASTLHRRAEFNDTVAWDALMHGKISAYKTAITARDESDNLSRTVGAWKTDDQYYRAHTDWKRIWDSGTRLPEEKVAQSEEYSKKLVGLRDLALARGDTFGANQYDTEIRALHGDTQNLGPTKMETLSGIAFGTTDDAAGTADAIQNFYGVIAEVAAGHLVYTYGDEKAGGFTPRAGGSSFGTIDSRYLSQDPNKYKAFPHNSPFGTGNVYVEGVPIMAVPTPVGGLVPTDYGYKPPSAEDATQQPTSATFTKQQAAASAANPNVPDYPVRVGTAYDKMDGDYMVRIYGVPKNDGTGDEWYTTDNPFAAGTKEALDHVNMGGQEVVAVSLPPGVTTPYSYFNTPATANNTGVVPFGYYNTPYLAEAMRTPDGQADLLQYTTNTPAAMQYAQNLFPTRPDAANKAYAEIVSSAYDTQFKFNGGYLPEHMQGNAPGYVGGRQAGGSWDVEHMQGNAPGALPALEQWQGDWAAANGVGALFAPTPPMRASSVIKLPILRSGQSPFAVAAPAPSAMEGYAFGTQVAQRPLVPVNPLLNLPVPPPPIVAEPPVITRDRNAEATPGLPVPPKFDPAYAAALAAGKYRWGGH